MTTPTKPRQLTYVERAARFPLDFSIDVGSEIKQVKVPAAWEAKHLVRLGPFTSGMLKFSPRVNIAAAPVFVELFKAIEDAGAWTDILSYDGGYYARLKRGVTAPPVGASKDVWGKQLSNHSRGCAIDLNARWNPMGHIGPAPNEGGSLNAIIVAAGTVRVDVETAGHVWPAGIVCGADWHGPSCDPMHFEVGTWEP